MNEALMKNLRNFIVKGDTTIHLDDDDNLFQEGYLDSMGVYELIDFIEQETGKEFDPDTLVAENFSSLNNIAKLLDAMK